MKRFLARHITFGDTDYRMSVAQFSDDFTSVEIFPFKEEIASTVFLEGKIVIRKVGKVFVVERNGRDVNF